MNDDQRLRRYLLRLATEEELDRIEEEYLATSDHAELITDVEGHLVSDYVHERLSEPERQAFESNYLVTPDRIQQVAIARALAEMAETRGPLPHLVPKAKLRWLRDLAGRCLRDLWQWYERYGRDRPYHQTPIAVAVPVMRMISQAPSSSANSRVFGIPLKNYQILVILLLVFLWGNMAGSLIVLNMRGRVELAAAPPETSLTLQRFTRELDLNTDQTKEIAEVLNDFTEYYQMLQAQMDEFRTTGQDRIYAILTPQQRAKFKKIMGELQPQQIR